MTPTLYLNWSQVYISIYRIFMRWICFDIPVQLHRNQYIMSKEVITFHALMSFFRTPSHLANIWIFSDIIEKKITEGIRRNILFSLIKNILIWVTYIKNSAQRNAQCPYNPREYQQMTKLYFFSYLQKESKSVRVFT